MTVLSSAAYAWGVSSIFFPESATALALAAAVGVVHVLAPDHALPLALLAWRERWSGGRVFLKSGALLLPHALAGAGLALLFGVLVRLTGLSEHAAWIGAALVLLFSGIRRTVRSGRILELVRYAPGRAGAGWTALGLMGPAEVLIPLGLRGAGVWSLFVFVGASWIGLMAVVKVQRQGLRSPMGLVRLAEGLRGSVAWTPWVVVSAWVVAAALY